MPTPRFIACIAGPKSHGPEGNGVHDYAWDARLAAAMLRSSSLAAQLRVEVFEDGWPEDDAVLDEADALVLFCDGRDGESYAEALHLESPQRILRVAALMRRGCGLAVLHFGTFASQQHAPLMLDWCGGHFRWQGEDGRRSWASAITTIEAEVQPASPGHPVLRGVPAFRLREEFYHHLAFPVARTRAGRPPRPSPELGAAPWSAATWSRGHASGPMAGAASAPRSATSMTTGGSRPTAPCC